MGRAADQALDPALGGVGGAAHQGDVDALDVVAGELLGKARMRRVRLGRDHHAGGVLVQPVHNPGPGDAPDARQASTAVVQQGVDQGAVGAPRGGMGGHASRLVDDDQVSVLEQHRQRNILRLRFGGGRRRQLDLIKSGPRLGRSRGQHLAVPADASLADQGLQAGAGNVGERSRQGPVQPPAGVLGPQLDLQDLRGLIARLVLAGHAHAPPLAEPQA